MFKSNTGLAEMKKGLKISIAIGVAYSLVSAVFILKETGFSIEKSLHDITVVLIASISIVFFTWLTMQLANRLKHYGSNARQASSSTKPLEFNSLVHIFIGHLGRTAIFFVLMQSPRLPQIRPIFLFLVTISGAAAFATLILIFYRKTLKLLLTRN
jgi:hypothetical protein